MGLIDLFCLPHDQAVADLDHPSTVAIHRKIIESKPSLQHVYRFFYRKRLFRNSPSLAAGVWWNWGAVPAF